MESLDVKKSVCKSCNGTDHKRSTNRLCPNSKWGKERQAQRVENTLQLKKSLKKFEDFIVEKNVTMDDLAPVYCANWMEFGHYGGNKREWKMEYFLAKKMIELHCDVTDDVFCCFDENEILNAVSDRTKIIFCVIGSNAADTWHSHTYRTVHSGTVILMRIWKTTVEAKNETCSYCKKK